MVAASFGAVSCETETAFFCYRHVDRMSCGCAFGATDILEDEDYAELEACSIDDIPKENRTKETICCAEEGYRTTFGQCSCRVREGGVCESSRTLVDDCEPPRE